MSHRIHVGRTSLELRRGPQDGARVYCSAQEWPVTIYVGPSWLGDGGSAWSVDHCSRFPCRYVLVGDGAQAEYVFQDHRRPQ